MNLSKATTFLLLFLFYTSCCFGFIEVSVGIASYLACKIYTCCSKDEIPGDFKALRNNLRTKLYGQPMVVSTVVNAIRSHWDERSAPSKALTISFHGGPGVGKNYVVKFIAEALFKNGMESSFVHNFNARLDFPEVAKVDSYKMALTGLIFENVRKCPKQLFVFDEVNQMPPGILDALKPFIDYTGLVDGVDFRRSIFVFLSNTGSSLINEHAYKLYLNGIEREDIKLSSFEKLISQGAFNEKGGFQYSETIKSDLIDHFVPFLPLMKPHVERCIDEEFLRLVNHPPSKKQKQEILDFIDWGPTSDHRIFSKTGCKKISQKTRLLAYDD